MTAPPAGVCVPVCAVCAAPCPPPFRAPTAELAPDLDGRPGEPARSTLRRWVARCRSCGAASSDLASLPAIAAETVRRPDYAAEPDSFLRWAQICHAAGQLEAAAEATLQAAWSAEDAGRDAAPLRRRAAGLWQGDPLRQIDILRRAAAFAEAQALAHAASFPPDTAAAQILAFERARIDAQDPARYAISSALRPPASKPHVTHGQKSPPTLLARLFGRRD